MSVAQKWILQVVFKWMDGPSCQSRLSSLKPALSTSYYFTGCHGNNTDLQSFTKTMLSVRAFCHSVLCRSVFCSACHPVDGKSAGVSSAAVSELQFE